MSNKHGLKNMEFGIYIRELREKRGLTLAQVAERLDLSINYVSQLERNLRKPTDKLVIEFSQLYKVDQDILFRKSGQIPLRVRKVINRNTNLQKSLSFVDKRNLSQEVEKQIVIRIHRMIAEFFNVDESDILSK
ncbi:helix-turn-helix domain-containing protein [Virgibacillus proomii]|uniref:helix-turn-helix domain-containing protein n=1 Tax=Virgibacillus proomii TaxID=84407 RepID=UPI0009876DC0|nr:helix-turn-helix domain-containing protein [Virgibacillus proomii]